MLYTSHRRDLQRNGLNLAPRPNEHLPLPAGALSAEGTWGERHRQVGVRLGVGGGPRYRTDRPARAAGLTSPCVPGWGSVGPSLRFPAQECSGAERHCAQNQHPTDEHAARRVVGLGVAGQCDTAGGEDESKEQHRDGLDHVSLVADERGPPALVDPICAENSVVQSTVSLTNPQEPGTSRND